VKQPVQNQSHKRAKNAQSEDRELWERVARTVKPLRPAPKFTAQKTKPAGEKLKSGNNPHSSSRAKPADALKRTAQIVVTQPKSLHPTGNLDRRQKQKMSRGNVDIDARLDLHGHSIEQARAVLRGFLASSRDRGHRSVLVITGKGASPFSRHTLHSSDFYHAPERQGRLRVELSRWMQEHEFSDHVVGFQPAHPKHGGGGAFYIRLRRKGTQT
jgi:DNA-nicking Smr family endonuclease